MWKKNNEFITLFLTDDYSEYAVMRYTKKRSTEIIAFEKKPSEKEIIQGQLFNHARLSMNLAMIKNTHNLSYSVPIIAAFESDLIVESFMPQGQVEEEIAYDNQHSIVKKFLGAYYVSGQVSDDSEVKNFTYCSKTPTYIIVGYKIWALISNNNLVYLTTPMHAYLSYIKKHSHITYPFHNYPQSCYEIIKEHVYYAMRLAKYDEEHALHYALVALGDSYG